MTKRVLCLALMLAAGPVAAQSPSAVPLRDKSPSQESTISRPDPRRVAPDTTESVRTDPNARNRRDGRVAPPAAIDSGVQVIAPEKR